MKRCCRCGGVKPLSEFNKNRRSKDGLHSYCRPCHRQNSKDYFEAHPREYRGQQSRRRLYLRQKLFEYYLAHPCVDCGEKDPVVLEFDHQGDKRVRVSDMVNRKFSWQEMLAEIAKCVVRCANCHRRRTAKQFGWYKHKNSKSADQFNRVVEGV